VTRAVAWIGFLAGALVGLHGAHVPPDGVVGPAFAAVRVVALVLGWYLLGVSVLGLASRAVRVAAAVRLTDAFTLPFVRRLLNVAIAASLSAPITVAVAAPPAVAAAAPSAATDVPVMHVLDEPPLTPPAPAPAPPEPQPEAAADYVVRPGDNFWSIAAHLLGPSATDADIVSVWRFLIDANADRVTNPSLIFSGQVLRVPTAPAPSLPQTD
jgi:nucleoid-associated protein YgaU